MRSPPMQNVTAGEETLELGVTPRRVLWMMPDRSNGYDLFAAAADGFGGPGATYDPETDGDTQVDSTGGAACRTQRYYIDFCYRDASNRFVAPVGGLAGMVLADLAGDGTTPPVGTVIRFVSPETPVDTEDDAPAQPMAFALGAAFPNPFSATATVPVRRRGIRPRPALGLRRARAAGGDARRWRPRGGPAPGGVRRVAVGGGDLPRRARSGRAASREEGARRALGASGRAPITNLRPFLTLAMKSLATFALLLAALGGLAPRPLSRRRPAPAPSAPPAASST